MILSPCGGLFLGVWGAEFDVVFILDSFVEPENKDGIGLKMSFSKD